MRADVAALLACPHCGLALQAAAGALQCASGHAFDVARQGYVNLLAGRRAPSTADTAEMVAARAAFFERGHFAPLRQVIRAVACESVASAAADDAQASAADHEVASATLGDRAAVVDVGGGTGYHTAAVLDGMPGRVGVVIDLSKHAARRAARCHPRAGAVVADAWRGLPVRDDVAALALSVFAPRNAAEIARILSPHGRLLVVTPQPDHLAPLVAQLDLLTVQPEKQAHVEHRLAPQLALVSTVEHRHVMTLARDDVRAVVAMGPSAWHIDRSELDRRATALPVETQIQVSVQLAVYRPA